MTNRGTIFLSEAEIIAHESWAANQHIIRLVAPAAAASALPGTFVHLGCDPSIPMRRPLSIMRVDRSAGWLELLYKPVGAGLAKLATRRIGEVLSVLAPIGNGFTLDSRRPRIVAIGGGVGIPPMIFLAQEMRGNTEYDPVVLMGSEIPFPFELAESALDAGVVAAGATHGLRLLEDWGIASRLASNAGLPGSYSGYVPDLARALLGGPSGPRLAETQILACGPEAMLRAVSKLSGELGIPCQIALEEYMACGVGGCAGCAVRVHTPSGEAMKRVCVDGPVFDAAAIYPDVHA
jgi:dihydroorotate dehydrogenase electron transfer subunit